MPRTLEKRAVLSTVLAVTCVLLVIGAFSFISGRTQRRAFDGMTPAQHLEAARADLLNEHSVDALNHLNAIAAGAPEASDARRLSGQIAFARQATQVEAESRVSILERKSKAARDLEARSIAAGYDLTVGQSDKPDELVITSKEFEDLVRRVRFLSFLRERYGPSGEVCLAGFQKVQLRTSGPFGFRESYSVDCSER